MHETDLGDAAVHARRVDRRGGRQLVRRHWSIENTLNWTLDVTLNEDRSRIRSKNGTQNFAACANWRSPS